MPNFGVVAVLKGGNEFVGLGAFCGVANGLHFGVLVSPTEVILNRARKKNVFLQNHANALAQTVKRVILYVNAVNQNFALVGVIKPRYHGNEGCFAATGRADNANGRFCGDFNVNLVKYAFLAVFIITEGKIFKFNLAFCNVKVGEGGVLVA